MAAFDLATALAALADARAALLRVARGGDLATLAPAGGTPVVALLMALFDSGPPPREHRHLAHDDLSSLLLAAWVAHQAALLHGDPLAAAQVLERLMYLLPRSLDRAPERGL